MIRTIVCQFISYNKCETWMCSWRAWLMQFKQPLFKRHEIQSGDWKLVVTNKESVSNQMCVHLCTQATLIALMTTKTSISIAEVTCNRTSKAPKKFLFASLKIPPYPAESTYLKESSIFTFIQEEWGELQ